MRNRNNSLPKMLIPAVLCNIFVLVMPLYAADLSRAEYAGGTASLARGTSGTLDTTSPDQLRFLPVNGAPAIHVSYQSIQSWRSTNEVAHHLGVLPAIAVGLVAARIRRYQVILDYKDLAGTTQVATFQMAEHDVAQFTAILRARVPQSCPKPACGIVADRAP